MKKIFLLLATCLPLWAGAQQIAYAEYFYDTDPGQGNGISIPITVAADSVTISATLPTTTLTPGVHNLFVRVRYTTGLWSQYEGRSLFVNPTIIPTVAPRIKAAEYFYDTDPGQGAGTPIALSGNADSVSLAATLVTTGLAPGVHNLFVRVQDSTNKWSHYEARSIYVKEVALPTAPRLIAAEYFYKTDPGQGAGTPISVTGLPADSILATATLSTLGRPSGNDTLYVRVQDSLGRWSQAVRQPFRICPTALPKPTISGNAQYCANDTLSLTASAVTGASGYYWTGPGGFTATTQTASRTSLSTSASGVYKVFAIRAGGTACDTSAADSITVTVIPSAPPPTVTVSVSPGTTITQGQQVTFTGTVTNGGGAPTYQWRKNGAPIPGATASTYTTTTLADGDIITLWVRSNEPCATPDSASSAATVITVTMGVAQVLDGSQLQIAPNPSNGLFVLSGNLTAPATLSYDIRDLTGRLIYEGTFPENATVSRTFDLRSAAPGIYLLRLAGPEGSSQQFRIVRQ